MLHGREYSKRSVRVNPPMGRASGPPMGVLLGAGGALSLQQCAPEPDPAAPPNTTAAHEDGSAATVPMVCPGGTEA